MTTSCSNLRTIPPVTQLCDIAGSHSAFPQKAECCAICLPRAEADASETSRHRTASFDQSAARPALPRTRILEPVGDAYPPLREQVLRHRVLELWLAPVGGKTDRAAAEPTAHAERG